MLSDDVTTTLPEPPPALRRRLPGEATVEQIAGMVRLAGRVSRAAVTPPLTWWREFVDQAWLLVARCSIAMAVCALFVGLAITVQGGDFLQLVGSTDRIGSGYVLGSIRESAPFLTGLVVAGVGGTAICADLGARRIRGELDALAATSVDIDRFLVLPRVLALVVVTAFGNFLTMAVGGLGAGLSASALFAVSPASFLGTFSVGFTMPDLVGSAIKALILGITIGIVFTYKGLNAKGGAEGVGRAVNQAVVIAFLTVFVIDFAFNSVLLAMFPETAQVR